MQNPFGEIVSLREALAQREARKRQIRVLQTDDLSDLIAAKTWECRKGEVDIINGERFERQGCGVIQPRVFNGKVFRRSCPCEDATHRRLLHQEERRKWLREQEDYTFGWLGARWSDRPLLQKTLLNFEQERQPVAYEAVVAFAEEMSGTLILYGPFGTGKTHLLAALCNKIRTREINPQSSRFVTAPKLFHAIQERIGLNEPSSSLIVQAIRAPLLVIDDIDKANPSAFREEVYFEIIDERTKAGRPLALSTNRMEDLALFVGGACASRLQIGQVAIEMAGSDYRRLLG
jgi:DNA replication protein DnaC